MLSAQDFWKRALDKTQIFHIKSCQTGILVDIANNVVVRVISRIFETEAHQNDSTKRVIQQRDTTVEAKSSIFISRLYRL